jgi:hypothetical protein
LPHPQTPSPSMERGLIRLGLVRIRVGGVVAECFCVREGTWVIASPPSPLSKYGEGAYLLGAGEDQGEWWFCLNGWLNTLFGAMNGFVFCAETDFVD